jgi:toxin ParE1/3/4
VSVQFTDAAKSDMKQIGDWIAEANPLRAVSFVNELERSCQQIGEFPRSYPETGKFQNDTVWRKVHTSYLIFYRIMRDRDVEILRVLHGARDFSELF